MRFSIIVPIYKVEKLLDNCITSLQNQTYQNIEIILVDDGSPDQCPAMCDEYASKDSRIKVIHKENGGLSDARNKGLDMATGDYVFFVDADDYIELDACEKFAKYAGKGYDILIGDALVEGGACNLQHIETELIMNGKQYLLAAHQAKKAPMAAVLNVYRKEFLNINSLRFKIGIYHEDEEFTPRCFLRANTVVCMNFPFYHYIIRENSITTSQDKRNHANDLYETCLSLDKLYDTLDDKLLKKYLKDSLSMKYLNIFQIGRLYQYGDKFFHKKFVLRNSYTLKTRIKAILYCLSPKLYYSINHAMKKLKG